MRIIDHIDHRAFLSIIDKEGEACISLYMPLVKAGREVQQNRILFGELSRVAAQKLERYAIDDHPVEVLTDRLDAVGKDKLFWERRPAGLAFFVSSGGVTVYRSLVPFEAEVIVDRRFYIRPLLPLLDDEPVSVLLVNREHARLLHCNSMQCDESLPPPELYSLESFLVHHDFEKSLQYESASGPPRQGFRGLPTYHGQGAAGDEAQENRYLIDYYRHFKNWIAKVCGNADEIYLAGDERNIGLFKKAAGDMAEKFSVLLKKNIKSFADEELFRDIREAIRDRVAIDNEQAYEQLEKMEAEQPGRAIHSPEPIVVAAHDKRIRVLFLPPENRHLWGFFDKEHHKAIIKKQPGRPAGEELFNLAAIRTLQNGGKVVVSNDIGSRRHAAGSSGQGEPYGAACEGDSAAICTW